jgi:DNA-binding LacI/PurR family transcriptional regulator
VFPSASADFYHPFLSGIEETVEELGCDLLLFTSAPVTDGRRRVFHENNRLRIADGALLLGRRIPAEELSRLVAEKFPFVCVGRRDDPTPGCVVPYVGADYVSATATVTARALELGHQRLAFVGPGKGAESSADRLRGFRRVAPQGLHLSPGQVAEQQSPAPRSATPRRPQGARVNAEPRPLHPADPRALRAVLDELLAHEVSAVFVEDLADADALAAAARERSLDVPRDLSVVALGDASRPVPSDADYSGFHIPRKEMGRQAVGLLEAILSGDDAEIQQLLPCELVEGSTLTAPEGL